MSEVKVNKVTPRSGTTLTIGDSGDTTNVVGTLQNNGAALVGDISSVVAGTNLSGGGTSGAVTINLADASTSAKGAASFSSDNFAASSGAVTIKDLGVATGEIQDNAITLAKMASGTDGNIISYDASGNPVAIATGNDGQVLTSAGAGAQPAFETLSVTPAAGSITTAQLAYDPNPFRNIVINGDMSLAQRSTSVSGIDGTESGYKTVDRMYTEISNAGAWTQSRSTSVPTAQGFATSLKMDCTTADSTPTFLSVETSFEGQNLQYLKKGTSSAVSTTLSFWVRSNKTGTYVAELRDYDNNRTISQAYTISSADTWEKKTLTYAGDTSGALGNDNGKSLGVTFFLAVSSTYSSGTLATSWGSRTNANRAVGQVNLADSTSNNWYITGVQLEASTVASEFEFLPIDVNLGRCQRYYYLHSEEVANNKPIGIGYYYSSSYLGVSVFFPISMRGTPTIVSPNSADYFKIDRAGGNDTFNSLATEIGSSNCMQCYNGNQASGTAGQAGYVRTNNASSYLAFEAEL